MKTLLLTPFRKQVIEALHAHTPLAECLEKVVTSFLAPYCTLFVADEGNSVVHAVSLDNGCTSILAGQHGKSRHRDGKPGLFCNPHSLAYDPVSRTLLVDEGSHIRRVTLNGVVSTLYESKQRRVSDCHGIAVVGRDCIVAEDDQLLRLPLDSALPPQPSVFCETTRPNPDVLCDVQDIAFSESTGQLFVVDAGIYCNLLSIVDSAGARALNFPSRGYRDGPIDGAMFIHPNGVAVDETRGLVLIADRDNNCLREVNVKEGTVRTRRERDNENKDVDGMLSYPRSVVVDQESGDCYVGTHTDIFRVALNGHTTFVAGYSRKKFLFQGATGLALV